MLLFDMGFYCSLIGGSVVAFWTNIDILDSNPRKFSIDVIGIEWRIEVEYLEAISNRAKLDVIIIQ